MWVIQFRARTPHAQWTTAWHHGEYQRHGAIMLKFERLVPPPGFEARVAYLGALGAVVEGGVS